MNIKKAYINLRSVRKMSCTEIH